MSWSNLAPVSIHGTNKENSTISEYVVSILSRAELAARYLVIAQARLIVARRDIVLDFSSVLEGLPLVLDGDEEAVSAADCNVRLRSFVRLSEGESSPLR